MLPSPDDLPTPAGSPSLPPAPHAPPAPSADDAAIFHERPIRPAFHWRLWLGAAAVVALAALVVHRAEAVSERRTRAALLAEHAELTRRVAPSYQRTRAAIERLAAGAVGPWEGAFTAEGFAMRELEREPVLFGRVRVPEVRRPSDVAASLRHRYPDQIGACLGVDTDGVQDFYRLGDFLMPSYVAQVRGASGAERLAYIRQDLHYRLARDAARLRASADRRYLVLAVDEAALSIDGPTRVYVWDLRQERLVLRARGTGSDFSIVPVRIAGLPGGGARVPLPTERLTLSIHDCSVASVVRAQLGAPGAALRHAPLAAR